MTIDYLYFAVMPHIIPFCSLDGDTVKHLDICCAARLMLMLTRTAGIRVSTEFIILGDDTVDQRNVFFLRAGVLLSFLATRRSMLLDVGHVVGLCDELQR